MSSSSPTTVVPKTYTEQPFDLHGLDGISDTLMTVHLALYAGSVTQGKGLNEELAAMTGRGQESGKNPEFPQLTCRLGFEYNGMLLQSTTSRASGWRPSRIR